mmetsp:Transcript_64602/g.127668  ORF Transcript_64602/g.127668 Transcript_64602/m.127668 type:complete len:229 (+) Transcript_64602:313-999(+)
MRPNSSPCCVYRSTPHTAAIARSTSCMGGAFTSSTGRRKSSASTSSSSSTRPSPIVKPAAVPTSEPRSSTGSSLSAASAPAEGLAGSLSWGAAKERHAPLSRAACRDSRMRSIAPLSTAESNRALVASSLSLRRLLLISRTRSMADVSLCCAPSRLESSDIRTALYFSPAGKAPRACSSCVLALDSAPPSCSSGWKCRRVASGAGGVHSRWAMNESTARCGINAIIQV